MVVPVRNWRKPLLVVCVVETELLAGQKVYNLKCTSWELKPVRGSRYLCLRRESSGRS